MIIKRGSVYLAALDPVIRNEIAKTRPVVVIFNDKNYEFSGTVTVLPITSKNLRKIYPFEVYLKKGTGRLPKNSEVRVDQIRTLDKRRSIKLIADLGMTQLAASEKALKIHLEI